MSVLFVGMRLIHLIQLIIIMHIFDCIPRQAFSGLRLITIDVFGFKLDMDLDTAAAVRGPSDKDL